MSRQIILSTLIVMAIAGYGLWHWNSASAPVADSQTTAGISPESVVLDETKQRQIWDSEHITFEIETHFGKRFLEALVERSPEGLNALMLPECSAHILNSESSIRSFGPLSETNSQTSSSAETEPELLVKSLLESIGDMASVERSRLRVLKIVAPSSQSESQWETGLLLTCHGASPSGEIVSMESHHDVVFRFEDKDALSKQACIQAWAVTSQTVRKSSEPLMTEITAETGLDKIPLPDNWKLPVNKQSLYNFQMAVEDFDRDGFLDIAIASGAMGLRPFLLRSAGGSRFDDVTSAMGLRPWTQVSGLVSWIDYDNDDFPDLLMGSRLYHNEKGAAFKDVTPQSGLRIGFNPLGVAVADYDADGLPDMYVLYQIKQEAEKGKVPWVGDRHSGAPNELWRNEGNGKFRNVTRNAAVSGGERQSFAATYLFFDDDHLPDLYIANDFGNNVMLRNRGDGSFEDISERSGCADFATSMGVSSGDLDNDGLPEIYVANMYSKMGRRIIGSVNASDYPPGVFEQIQGSCAGNRLYQRTSRDEPYHEVSEQLHVNAVGWAFAPAMADIDGDGYLDMYGTTGYRSFERKKPDG